MEDGVEIDVVTGATGQVGLELCRTLAAAGRSVRALVLPRDPSAPALREAGVEVVEGDVRDASALRAALRGGRHLYHLAAIVSTTARHDPRMWQVNVEGARLAAGLSRELGLRMVYFSSIVVFDPDPLDHPLDEDRPRVPVAGSSPYVQSKVAGEQVVRAEVERGLDAVIVHPTVVVGPNETHHVGVVQSLLHRYFERRLPAVFTGGFDAVAASDVVAGAIAAASRGRSGHGYILGGTWHPVQALLRRAQPLCGAPVPRIAVPLALARAGLPAADLVARLTRQPPALTAEDLRQLAGNRRISTAKARRELGYDPTGLDDALARVHAEWQRRRAG
ncbi:MAG: NAD-dependent epimerase/dehydratase family protein [Myxococcales bacterium]|nr:NAD-dependent epimerase/dehydratase family protein [Myxococcales bacterium]